VMTENNEVRDADVAEASEGEEMTEPRSKYERIMLAAAEATRLNEEFARKGIKTNEKVTIEALKRVDEGKVKGVRREPSILLDRPPEPAPAKPRDSLFSSPPGGDEGPETDAESEGSPKPSDE